ncbi:MAG: hypothetical protein IJD92_04240 [Bacilli bacterium]|nr:hypothetical protein [Bacilli bacterium]
MKNLSIEDSFVKSISFLDNIMLLDSFEDTKKVYNMVVDYLKKDSYYVLCLNVYYNEEEIIKTKCKLANKINGSIVIKDIINMVTNKYNNDLIIDVKEIDNKNNCIKFGRRTYNSKN